MDSWVQEREEIRIRMELNEAKTKKAEDLLVAIAMKLGVSRGEESNENFEEVESHQVPINHDRWRKLDIPIFMGDDAYGFKIAVVRIFQPAMVQNPFELLLSLKQEGSVEAYVEEFEKYAGALKEIIQEFIRVVFLNGLKEELRVEVKLYDLETLQDVIHKTILIEQKNLVVQKRTTQGYVRSSGASKESSYQKVVSVNPHSTCSSKKETSSVGSVVGSSRSLPKAENSRGIDTYRRLSSAEMRENREKWLCFSNILIILYLQAVYEHHPQPKKLIVENDLPQKLQNLIGERRDGQVLVKQMATSLLKALHINTVL
ncbi:hypothetical protein Lal_00024598 [Lupinus albus]|nr:hypothetical protein Lal_00024598 [Lupinus albus]